MTRRTVLALILLIGLTACASGGGGSSALYRRDVGITSLMDGYNLAVQIMNRYGFQPEQQDTVQEINILTHWKKRAPFADELELGATDAESRLLIVGRPRGTTELGSNFNIQVTVENRIRVAGGADWNETTNTPMFVRYADEMIAEYRRLVTNIGVRRY